ncbi:MAG: 5-formyltetrahydrofolate cyclo-ligase [Solimonas sp.]
MRRELRARRLSHSRSLSVAQKSRAAARAARHALRELRASRARRVAVYLAYGSELPTQALIDRLHARGLRVAIPRITGPGRMHFEWLSPTMPLRRNRYGIAEPARRGTRAWRGEFDAVVLPLLGFDAHGNRLGTGGGYYDRWLARPRVARRPRHLGYAYAIQQVEQIPREPWDVRLDVVITEKGVLWPIG